MKPILTSALMLMTLSAGAFTVTEAGKPAAEIVIKADAAEPIATAAKELRHWIKEISGAELPVAKAPSENIKRHIRLTCDSDVLASFPDVAAKLAGNDGYAFKQRGDELFVLGSVPKGVLNGVYQLLFKNTDIIWARPNDEFGTLFTPNPNLVFNVTDFIDTPYFSMRGWQTRYGATEYEFIWAVRNLSSWTSWSPGQRKENDTYGMIKEMFFGHNITGMYITADKYYKSHPEFFPEIKGKRVDFNHAKRRPQLCFTNQEMIECFKKEFEYHVQRVPGCKIYGIFAEDNYELCQCAKCREDIKLANGRVLKYGDPDFQSTRFFQFLTPIAEFAKKRFPDILISTYAYFFTEIPPAIDVPDNVIILTCPIYKNVKFPMATPQNKETFDKLNGWLKKTDKIILYDYFGLTRKFPRPVDVSAAADYKYLHEHGVRLTHSEIMSDNFRRTDPEKDLGIAVWDCNSIYYWTMSQLVWNPYQDIDALRDEYLKRVFGPAAADVKEYLSYTETAWRASSQPSTWATDGDVSWAKVAELGFVPKCRAALQRARGRKLSEKSRKMLERLALTFDDNDTFRLDEMKAKLLADFRADPTKKQNMVVNPGFETLKEQAAAKGIDWVGSPFEGWSFWKQFEYGTYGCRPGEGTDGSNAAYFEGAAHAFFLQKFNVSPGQAYLFRCKAKTTDSDDSVQLTARWQNEQSAWVCVSDNRDFYVENLVPGKWFQYEGVVIVPKGAAQMVLHLGSRRNKGRILFDDAEVYRLDATEYRVPLNGIRTYDNANNWFATHEDSVPMAGVAVDNLSEFSTSLWFRVAKMPVRDMDKHRDVASLYSRGWSQELRLTPEGKLLNHYCLTDRETYFPGAPRVFCNHWMHVVTTFSVEKQQVVTYVDGIRQGEYKGKLTPVRNQARGCRLIIGQSPDHWNPFDGDIADLRWFDHALSETEVKALFAKPLPEIAKQLENEEVFQDLLKIYPVAAPLGDGMILPNQQFDKKTATAKELHVTLAPGEYDPCAVALHAATEDLRDVRVIVAKEPASASGAVIPASAIDLKYVQCWYQGGTAWDGGINAANESAKLVPELLVNDPNLVTVDFTNGNQYVKLGGVDGVTARSVHGRKTTSSSRWDGRYPVSDNNDIRDAKTLQPFNLNKGMTRELFITVHAPENAAPGEYIGRLEFRLDGPLLCSIPLKITVLPFRLATPRLACDLAKPFTPSLYYVNGMAKDSEPELNPMRRSAEQITAELADLKAHGIDNPFNYQLQTASFDLELLRKMLRMRKEAGLSNRPAFLSGPESNMGKGYNDSDEAIADLRQKVRDIMAVIKEECGHSDVYFYGVDEASKEKVAAQKKLWDAIHEEGGKVFTSDCSIQCFGADIDGKMLDLLTLCRDSSPKFAAKRHATGGLIFSYGNPQGGVENPLIYRRNYGIRLWKHNYDGFATYCYYEAFGHPWDDFDSQHYRDHNLVYPTADGVIDTLAWEGFREAVDDIRYASTLALAIKNNPAHPQAKAAQAFLDAMTGEERDLDALRRDIIGWILKLQK